MNKVVAALAAAGIVVSSVIATPIAANAEANGGAPSATSIAWGPCDAPVLRSAHAECGFLRVPLDYAKPSGGTISLAVSRVRHTSPESHYQGVILVNPGGPGGSGLPLSTLGSHVPNHAGDDYDWIGFDPRGVGSSVPALHCEPDYFASPRPDYVPTDPAVEQAWLNRAKKYAAACGSKAGPLLAHMSTADSARDMDSLRIALGQQRINYYGFSYGTYLGQVYSTMFPDHVRRMVLDSNVDPRRVWYQANLDQDVAFNRNIKIWFRWIAQYDKVFHLGTTEGAVEQSYYATQAALAQQPAGGVIGPDEWTDIFLQAGYYRMTWVNLGNAFADWVHKGDWQQLKALYEQTDTLGDDNGYAVYDAVQCVDAPWPTDWNTWRKDNWATQAKAPFETWANAWYNAPCVFWPAKPGTPVTIDGRRVNGALLIDETLDAATPYAGSLEVRALYPSASLIAEPGGMTHADSLFGDACVDNQVANYLATGALPPRKPGQGPDAVCAPLPDPVPTSS